MHLGGWSAAWPSRYATGKTAIQSVPICSPLKQVLAFENVFNLSPEALKQQLALGGRLIIPIGQFGYQTLIRVRRTGKDSFEEEEDFGAVAFVPLIGEEGWAAPKRAEEAPLDAEPSGFAAGLLLPEKRARTIQNRLSRLMAEAAEPFGDLHELCELVERFADCRVILLGEATHGTAEFYQARARITEMLVDRHGFNIVAVEADWPDAAVYYRE